ncbi:MAG: preprotein translocase subunit SecE, partial [Thermodesulfobacteriota bacterium]
LANMKKVKTKKKHGLGDSETKPVEKGNRPSQEGEISIVPKGKDKGNLKKLGPKEDTEEGLVAKWVEKNQWVGQVRDFFREVRIELKKVTWPSRKETIAATGMVIILSVLVAFFVGLLDIWLYNAVGILLKI